MPCLPRCRIWLELSPIANSCVVYFKQQTVHNYKAQRFRLPIELSAIERRSSKFGVLSSKYFADNSADVKVKPHALV